MQCEHPAALRTQFAISQAARRQSRGAKMSSSMLAASARLMSCWADSRHFRRSAQTQALTLGVTARV